MEIKMKMEARRKELVPAIVMEILLIMVPMIFLGIAAHVIEENKGMKTLVLWFVFPAMLMATHTLSMSLELNDLIDSQINISKSEQEINQEKKSDVVSMDRDLEIRQEIGVENFKDCNDHEESSISTMVYAILHAELSKHMKDRESWDQERCNLIAKLQKASRCAKLYRSLLHEVVCLHDKNS